jgi:hypothetical protein
VGGVLVVDGSARVRAALAPVYAALGLEWRPETAGSVADEIGRVAWERVRDALLAELRSEHVLEPAELEPAVLERARSLEARFRADPTRVPVAATR